MAPDLGVAPGTPRLRGVPGMAGAAKATLSLCVSPRVAPTLLPANGNRDVPLLALTPGSAHGKTL